MISSEFGFSAPPVFAGVQPQSADFAETAREDSKHSHRHRASFSHILAGLSKNAEESASSRSRQNSKQTGDASAQPGDGSASASAVETSAQPSALTLQGLLALLGQQQISIKDGPAEDKAATANGAAQLNSAPPAGQANTTQGSGTQTAASLRADATSLLPALGVGKAQAKRTDEKTSDPHAARRGAPVGAAMSVDAALRVPQLSGEALETGAGFGEASKGAVPAANGNPMGQPGQTAAPAENAQSADAANGATANAPLAFTMLLSADGANANPASATSSESASLASTEATAIQHAVSGLMASAAAQSAPGLMIPHDGNTGPNAGPTAIAEIGTSPISDGRVPKAEQASSNAGAEADANSDSRSELVRDVRVQVQTDNNQRVDVRMVDVGGELRVSVRSADANLTQALQQHMPELTNRLEQQHVHAEVWIPHPAQTSNTGASNARNFSSQDGGNAGEGNSGGRQNGRQNNQPDWLDEDFPGQTGVKEKANYIWVQ